MSDIAIRFENISKQYRLGNIGTGTLSHDLKRWWTVSIRGKEDPYLKIGQVNDRSVKATSDYVWALKDINLEVKQGEVLGIIGKNGAGKSTLLKILSRVTTPTTGIIKAKGRIASLLEIGTGFHPEMTGRENIYMNGSIMGMTNTEITRKLDEIVDFAGVEKYIDTPVKRYSSGMTVRLGFAIAAHLEPEILVVDEVLAVGDAEFQKKAIGKMQNVSRNNGRTVLFVSHNMGSINALCTKAILLSNGYLEAIGNTADITAFYYNNSGLNSGEFLIGRSSSAEVVVIETMKLLDEHGMVTRNFRFGDNMVIELGLITEDEIEFPYIWILVKSSRGPLFAATGMIDGYRTSKLNKGKNTVRCTFFKMPLLPNLYTIHVGIRSSDGTRLLTDSKDIGDFNIIGNLSSMGLNGDLADILAPDLHSPLIPYQWEFNDGSIYKFDINRYVE
jgi:lipopolysaccharide transport system ATP-binding protein